MVRVTFQQHFGIWSAGDTAGFDAETAARLVGAGAATVVTQLPAAAVTPAPAVPSEGLAESPPQALSTEKPATTRRKKQP